MIPGTLRHPDALAPQTLVTALYDNGFGALGASWLAEQGPEEVARRLDLTVGELEAKLSAELEYADRLTLARAIDGRREL